MKQGTLQLETLACPSCLLKIEAAVKGIEGVDRESIKILFNASKAKFRYDEEKTDIEKIAEAVEKVGYQVLKSK